MKVQQSPSLDIDTKKDVKKITKENMPKKQKLSERDIREKLAANIQIQKPIVKTLKGETKSVEDNSLLLKSDVGVNSADDTTKDKLKKVLSMNAFNFNPKERENLERILNG